MNFCYTMRPPSYILVFLTMTVWGSSTVTLALPNFWYCQKDWGYYKNGSAYEYNLRQLVAGLASNASVSSGYYHDTVGAGGPDQINGLIMCYADANWTDCLDCLKTAANEIANLSICQYSMTAATHYGACFLHYSNQNFFSVTQSFQPMCLQTPNATALANSTGVQYFLNSSSMQQLISDLTTEASNSEQKYASNKTNYTTNRTMYGLVQCTRDMTADQCSSCVKSYTAIANCSDQLGARIMGPNCYLRYELYSFYVAQYNSSSPVPVPATPPTPSPSVPGSTEKQQGSNSITVIAASISAGLLLLLVTSFLLWRRRRGKMHNKTDNDFTIGDLETNLELIMNPSAEYQVFDLNILRNATQNFSDMNKLGQGGFGPVYKGTLTNGQEIAVKRLSGSSLQGLRELKNEVELLAKLKHRNLVQLLGCCIAKNENILCYEFLPNGSLDKILFAKDPSKRLELGWKMRYKIIEGIARGLHYLHEESRLKIIHRDLKASNILLDKDMGPKISDFGLARFFGEDQTHIDTSVIAGTFGYMAPEYVMHGNFSTKSDVYSFGVLLLEIVTGKRNSSFAISGCAVSLVSHAWQHWKNNKIEQLKDPMLEDAYLEEIVKCIHVALLCVQEEPSLRPNMEAVSRMLAGGAILRLPSTRRVPAMDISSSNEENSMAMRSLLAHWSSDSSTSTSTTTR